MRKETSRQLINAMAAAQSGKGQKAWVVLSKHKPAQTTTRSRIMTYREACAEARAIREACGYATVERIAK